MALRNCNWLLVVLYGNALKSKWVKRELAYALESDRYNGRIISIVKAAGDYFEVSWTRSSLQRIDFTKRFDRGCVELLRTWGLVHQAE